MLKILILRIIFDIYSKTAQIQLSDKFVRLIYINYSGKYIPASNSKS